MASLRQAMLPLYLLVVAGFLTLPVVAEGKQPAPKTRDGARSVPLVFEENRGQWPDDVSFVGRTPQYALAVQGSDLHFAFAGVGTGTSHAAAGITLSLAGGHTPAAHGLAQAGFLTNYYLGKDATTYRTGIRNYTRIGLDEVYPGIREELYAQGSSIEHDFVVAPQADPSAISLKILGPGKAALNDAGEVIVPANAGRLYLRRPVAYQVAGDGRRTPVGVAFRLHREGRVQSVGFALDHYDRNRELVIDPVIVYATYVSGKAGSAASAITSDTPGNVYLAGSTTSAAADFGVAATTSDVSTGSGATTPAAAAFVARFNSADAGSAVAWLSYFGSTGGASQPTAVALQGGTVNLAVAGTTAAMDFPTTANSFQAKPQSSGPFGFLALLATADGTLQSATYVDAGSSSSTAVTTVSSVASDAAGNILAGGSTTGGALPTSANSVPVQFVSGNQTGFLLRLDPQLQTSNYATYLAGTTAPANTTVTGVGVDTAGNLYASGYTTGNFPQAGSYGTAFNTLNGAVASFAAQIMSPVAGTPSQLGYSVWVSGTGSDQANGLIVDAAGDALLFGQTTSGQLPAGTTYTSSTVTTPAGIAGSANPVSALPPTKVNGATGSGFLAQINPAGQPQVLTYLGGDGNDAVAAAGVDSTGLVYAAGTTSSVQTMSYTGVPLLPTGQDTSSSDVQHGFLAQLPGTLGAVSYLGNFGGASGTDGVVGVALDGAQNAYVAGNVASNSAAYTSYTAFQATPLTTAPTGSSAYVAKVANATASAQISLVADPQGSPDPIGYTAGSTESVTYRWRLTSAATPAPGNLVVQIPQQADLTYTAATLVGDGGETIPCTVSSAGASCLIASFPQAAGADDPLTLRLTATLKDQPAGNSLTVTASVYTADSEVISAAETSTVIVPAQLSITAAQSPLANNTVFTTDSTANPASTSVTYIFTLANAANAGPASNATFTLTPPTGTGAFVTTSFLGPNGANCTNTGCTGLTIPAGTSVVFSVTGRYPDAALNGGASATANQLFTSSLSGSLSAASNSYTAITTLQRGVHLVLSNNPATLPATLNLGDSVSYGVSVTNNGPSASSGSDGLAVTLPAGFTPSATGGFNCSAASPSVCTLSIGSLANGAQTTYTITGSFPDTAQNANVGITALPELFSAAATLSGDIESGTTGSDYHAQAGTSVTRTATLSITTSSLSGSATVCGGGSATCLYMQNSADTGDRTNYNIVIKNAGPNISVNTMLTLTLPAAPANPAGTLHLLMSGTPTSTAAPPAFGTALTCTLSASGNQVICSGGNLPVGTTALTLTGTATVDASTVPVTAVAVTTAASPGSVTLTQNANGTPTPVQLPSLEIDRAAHLVTVKTVAATGNHPASPLNLEESNPGQAAGVNDLLTATISVGDTPLNSAPSVVVTDTLPPFFKVTTAPSVACTANGTVISANYTTAATPVTLTCPLGTVVAGSAVAASGTTPASVGSGAASLTYSGKFVDNGASADITGTPASKVAQLPVPVASAVAATAVAVDPLAHSDATSAAASVNVARSVHILLRKTRNTTVATAPASFADTTDPNLDEKTAATPFGVNDEIEYDIALANGGVNKALGVQFTDTLPPFFTAQRIYLIAGAATTPDTGANSAPGSPLPGLVCYAGAAASGTPITLPYATGAGGQQITCVYGTTGVPVAVMPGTSRAGNLDNATAIEAVYQGKYQDNAPGTDDINAGVSSYSFSSPAGSATGSASQAVDSAPNAGDNLSAAVPAYRVQRAAHLRILGAPTQTTNTEAALTAGTTGPIIAEAEPSAGGGNPVFNCLRSKVYVQNAGPNIARQPQLTLATPAGLQLTSSITGLTTTPGSDAPLPSTCSYNASVTSPLQSGSALVPLTQTPNSTLVFDADGYFGLNTLTGVNSQGGFVLSYTALTDPGIMDSAKNTFSTVSGAALTVVNTPVGSNFVVVPYTSGNTRPVTLTFSSVNTPGITTEGLSSTGPALPAGTPSDPRYGNVPLYRTGAHAQFYSLATSAVPAPGTNPTAVCVSSGVPGSPLADTFAKPERVLLWALNNLPGGTALNSVPHVTSVAGDITTSVTPFAAAAYSQAVYPTTLSPTGTVSSIPGVQSQPAQVCGRLNGFAAAAAPTTLAVLEPVNFSPIITTNSAQISPNTGKGVSEVSFLFPNAYDYNDSDPCYIDATTTRKTCNDNLLLTTWVFGAEKLIPAQAHVLGPLAPAQAAAQGFLNSTVGLETQAGATYFELVADQLGALAYAATGCDPGISSSGYSASTTAACPVASSSLAGTPPQVTDFGSGEVAELVPTLGGGSSGLILLPPAANPSSPVTAVATGYVAAAATVTQGQTVGFQWNLLSIVPAVGTYALSCTAVDAATLSIASTLPTGLSCQLPSTITYNTLAATGAPANPAIYIVTTGNLTARNAQPFPLRSGGEWMAGLLLPFLLWRRRTLNRKALGLLTVLLLLAGAAGLPGCGSGSTGSSSLATPAGTYYFRVTATPVSGSGTLTTTAFSVKVLPGS